MFGDAGDFEPGAAQDRRIFLNRKGARVSAAAELKALATGGLNGV